MTRFEPDPSRSPEFLACLWQGELPAGFVLRGWLYLEDTPGAVLLIWEGDDSSLAYVNRTFGGFGRIATETVRDATPAMAAALARDLDGFGTFLAEHGSGPEEVARQVDLRRRGLNAASQEEAATAGRAWAEEQAG
jgi:hypothetical protein